MPDEKLIHPPAMGEGQLFPPAPSWGAVPAPMLEGGYGYYNEPETGRVDVRRYILTILRYKWLLVVALVVGSAGAYVAWHSVQVSYTAQGSLWIEVDRRQGGADVAPIRAGALVESSAWIDLLRTNQVLEPVVIQERLFVRPPEEYAPAFASFELADPFGPGTYELRVGSAGEDFVLVTREGALVQQAAFGVPIGENVGFRWQPAKGSFPPDAVVTFTVLSPRDAARDLSDQLQASLQGGGNFLGLELSGTNPQKLASTLNEVMERHVSIAAELKRSKLDETLVILEEQLDTMELELARAEENLEEFRITTISLPSDRSMPISAGLELTTDPVFGTYFANRVEVEQLRRDRARLQAALESFDNGPVRIEALEIIPAAAGSSELRRILDELVSARSELRVLQDRYSDDYPPIQDLLVQIETIESRSIPRVVRGIISELGARGDEMQGYVDSAAVELQEIPPRTIEEGRLRRSVATTENLYNEIRGRVETARLAAASSIPDVRILDRAAVPTRPTEDLRIPLAALILFGSLGAAVGSAILLDRLDARFRYAADVTRGIGLDILGSIPRIEAGRGRRGVLNAAQALEAFRELRIHVGFAFGSAGPITLTITSPSAGEGKSLISSNLAVAFAEVGKRTLLIDGDTRRGDAHRLLGRERSPGLIDYLKERSADDIIQATEHANLDFIGSGSRGVSTPELLASPRMAYFVGSLKRTYDVIIVDSPPLASGGDPLILASLTGNLAVVIRTGSTEKALTYAKLDQLSRLPIRVLGAVLNDVSAADAYSTYYGSYLPGYQPVPEEGEGDEGTQLLSESVNGTRKTQAS